MASALTTRRVALGCVLLASGACHGEHHRHESAPAPVQTRDARVAHVRKVSPDARAAVARVIELPKGAPGIGFDDLGFDAALGKLLVPAGRSGRLDLVDSASHRVVSIAGFSRTARYRGGHDDGVTSADAGPSVIYATDRTKQQLIVVDPAAKRIVASVPLGAHPDYVRYVAPTREVWVTEPDADQLEVFSVGSNGRRPRRVATVAVRGGPESLVVDPGRSRLYTHLWRGATVAIDIRARKLVARWSNGCRSSRGIAIDASRGLLMAGCAEGRATVLDLATGRRLSMLKTGAGVDIIAYDPRTRHLYVPSGKTATMVVASLSRDGRLTALGSVPTARGARCVTTDQRRHAYVCDPRHGRLLVVTDRFGR